MKHFYGNRYLGFVHAAAWDFAVCVWKSWSLSRLPSTARAVTTGTQLSNQHRFHSNLLANQFPSVFSLPSQNSAFSSLRLHRQSLQIIMPPAIVAPPQEPSEFASIESRIQSNYDEIAHLKVSQVIDDIHPDVYLTYSRWGSATSL